MTAPSYILDMGGNKRKFAESEDMTWFRDNTTDAIDKGLHAPKDDRPGVPLPYCFLFKLERKTHVDDLPDELYVFFNMKEKKITGEPFSYWNAELMVDAMRVLAESEGA